VPYLATVPPVGIFNRRNAVLGWAVWKIGKRKAKGALPGEGGGRKKSAVALGLAGAAGALTFWRKKKSSSETS
jgi:hypothetical protein